MKLFISSLISGFEAERAEVAAAARVLRWEVLQAEDFGARPSTPQHECLDAIRQADAVVLILGGRYGDVQPSGLSATHEEWREAKRTQKPVLVFVQELSDREPAQRDFLDEVQDWAGGRFRESFRTPAELRDHVTRALADLSTTGLADEQEMCARALDALPVPRQGVMGLGPRLVVAVAGGPRQQILRPGEIEDRRLIADLQRDAMFNADGPLDQLASTTPTMDGNRLRISQDQAELTVDEDGTVVVSCQATPPRDGRETLMPSVLEEDVRESIGASLRFTFEVLHRIDPDHRLTDVVPVAALYNADHTPWRTRADARANPNRASMPMGRGDQCPAMTSPPGVRRAALAHDADRVAEDLTVLLRRQHQ